MEEWVCTLCDEGMIGPIPEDGLCGACRDIVSALDTPEVSKRISRAMRVLDRWEEADDD